MIGHVCFDEKILVAANLFFISATCMDITVCLFKRTLDENILTNVIGYRQKKTSDKEQ